MYRSQERTHGGDSHEVFGLSAVWVKAGVCTGWLRFEDTIAAQFYGHTHEDEFEVFYDVEDEERAVGVAYITPAVTTFSYLNPSYRVFTMDAENTWVSLSIPDPYTRR